jgi:AcrR family transcriptional regulator
VTTRLTRIDQVERNRGLVLGAARRVFLREGYGGATVDAIAEEAGFSKGVVYSQFEGKADLFLALLDERISERAEENARLVAEHAGLAALLALLHTNARHSEQGPEWARLLIEFRLVAARDPRLSSRYAALHERTLDQLADILTLVLSRDGLTAVLPPRTVAQLVLALDSGAVLERIAEPAALPPEVLEEVLGRLVIPC